MNEHDSHFPTDQFKPEVKITMPDPVIKFWFVVAVCLGLGHLPFDAFRLAMAFWTWTVAK
jgi:hypothetical protein